MKPWDDVDFAVGGELCCFRPSSDFPGCKVVMEICQPPANFNMQTASGELSAGLLMATTAGLHSRKARNSPFGTGRNIGSPVPVEEK